MNHHYENSDAYVKKTLDKYEVAYDMDCWQKIESALPKRLAEKNGWTAIIANINLVPKKWIGIGVSAVFVVGIVVCFLFFFTSTKNNFSKIKIPVTTEKVENKSVQKNNFSIPQNTSEIKKEIVKTQSIPVAEKPIPKEKISVQKNNFSAHKNSVIVQKQKKDSMFAINTTAVKSANENNFDFEQSVEKKDASAPFVIQKDTINVVKKHKQHSKKYFSEGTNSVQ